MLRRPHERASNVIPQLPKQPEMADTRLRYRRIAPETRSGSIASLGGHFPARFHFPHRTSLLESLTSDDETSSFASSFAIRKRRSSRRTRSKRKRAVAARASFSSDDGNEGFDGLGAEIVDEERPIYHPKMELLAAMGTEAPVRPNSPVPQISFSNVSYEQSTCTPQSTSPTTPTPGSPVDTDEVLGKAAVAVELKSAEVKNVRKSSRRKANPNDEAGASMQKTGSEKSRASSGLKVSKMHSQDSSVTTSSRDSRKRSKRKTKRDGSSHSSRDKERDCYQAAGITTARDGRPIAAPESMNAEMRANFVLVAEQPMMYRVRTEESPPPKSRRKAEQGASKKMEKKASVSSSTNDSGFMREKEMSVSFAHRRYTAEEAAVVKPLNALQRLLQAVVLLKLGPGRRSKR